MIVIAEFPEKTQPVGTLLAEHAIDGQIFGMRGHAPFKFRQSSIVSGVDILYQEQTLATLQQAMCYDRDRPHIQIWYELRTPDLATVVQQRVRAAADALCVKMESAQALRAARKERIAADIFALTGPRDTNKASVNISSPETKAGFQALLFSGIAARVLPQNVHLTRSDKDRWTFNLDHVEIVGRQRIVSPICRLRMDMGEQVFALGPGDRKPARLAFVQNILDEAHRASVEIGEDPAFIEAAERLITRHAPQIAVLRATRANQRAFCPPTYLGRQVDAYHGMVAPAEKPRVQIEGTPFSLAEPIQGYGDANVYYHDTRVIDHATGSLPTIPAHLREDFAFAVTIAGLLADDTLLAGRYEADQIRRVLRENPAHAQVQEVDLNADPEVDLFI